MDQPFVDKVWELTANNIIMVSAIGKITWIMERKRSSGFGRNFTVDFFLFLAPVEDQTLRSNRQHLPSLK